MYRNVTSQFIGIASQTNRLALTNYFVLGSRVHAAQHQCESESSHSTFAIIGTPIDLKKSIARNKRKKRHYASLKSIISPCYGRKRSFFNLFSHFLPIQVKDLKSIHANSVSHKRSEPKCVCMYGQFGNFGGSQNN